MCLPLFDLFLFLPDYFSIDCFTLEPLLIPLSRSFYRPCGEHFLSEGSHPLFFYYFSQSFVKTLRSTRPLSTFPPFQCSLSNSQERSLILFQLGNCHYLFPHLDFRRLYFSDKPRPRPSLHHSLLYLHFTDGLLFPEGL